MVNMQSQQESRPAGALIVGCGDVGARIARRLGAEGVKVTGIVRRPGVAADLEQQGIAARCVDLDSAPVTALPAADWVFWCAPPPPQGRHDSRLRRWLPALAGRRVVYGSTTGVYGDCGGRWIDETEPTAPLHDRGHRRLDAETALRASGVAAVILRIPGIYGPGRWPLARLRAGAPVIRADQSPPSNRIHAEDLAAVALLAARRGAPGRVYHVGDGQPSSMTDYFQQVAAHFGLPPPPEVDYDTARRTFTPSQWSFIEGAKRLRVTRAREELGFVPVYPDLAAGLRAAQASGEVSA